MKHRRSSGELRYGVPQMSQSPALHAALLHCPVTGGMRLNVSLLCGTDPQLKYLHYSGICVYQNTGTHHAQLAQAEVPSLTVKAVVLYHETTHIHLLQSCCYKLWEGEGREEEEEELSKGCSGLKMFVKMKISL